tara:strand:- start:169 stop:360 length:192 start_codon:yes stop_codon:yes gene_type:complete
MSDQLLSEDHFDHDEPKTDAHQFYQTAPLNTDRPFNKSPLVDEIDFQVDKKSQVFEYTLNKSN